jgi:SAM-dependent methyltransferase
MIIFKKLQGFVKYLNQNMPLEKSKNYDDYWDNREVTSDISKLSANHRKRILAEQLIPNGSSVLDIGCGTAGLNDAFIYAKKDIVYTGYDMFDKLDDIQSSKKIKLYNKDILQEKYLGIYDYITILNVLEHVHHPEDFIEKIRPNFRKSLFVSVPNIGSLKNRVRLGIFGKFPITGVYFHASEHIRFWTVKDFKHWSNVYGYDVKNYYGTGYWGWGVKFFPSLVSENILYQLTRKDEQI